MNFLLPDYIGTMECSLRSEDTTQSILLLHCRRIQAVSEGRSESDSPVLHRAEGAARDAAASSERTLQRVCEGEEER